GVAGALELAPLAVAGALPAVLDAAGRLPADIGFGLGGGSNGERGGPRCDQAADDPVHGEILLPRPTGPAARIFAPSSAFEGPASAGDARSGRARSGLVAQPRGGAGAQPGHPFGDQRRWPVGEIEP